MSVDARLAEELAVWLTHANEIPFGYFEAIAREAGSSTPRTDTLAFFATLAAAGLIEPSPHNDPPVVDGFDPDDGWVLTPKLHTATSGLSIAECEGFFVLVQLRAECDAAQAAFDLADARLREAIHALAGANIRRIVAKHSSG